MSYRFADSLRAVSKPVWHIPLLSEQWKTPDDGQRKCPKHVEFHFKNKFEKLLHLVGFIISISTYTLYIGRMVIFSTDMRLCKTATHFVTLNCYKYEQNCVICSLLIHCNLKQINVVYSNWIPSNSDKQCISKYIKKHSFELIRAFKVN